MRCRYCGKELALLKRLTGGGEFCSDAHKQSYQDEFNRLALSRLLQAQTKSHGESPGKKVTPATATPVAVEEPAKEETFQERRAEAPSVMEHKPLELSTLLESKVQAEAPPEAPGDVQAEPVETAEFLIDNPTIATLPEEGPYLEPWLELSSGPAVIDAQAQKETFALSASAALLSLNFQANASPAKQASEPAGAQATLTPREFTEAPDQPSMPWKVRNLHQLPSAGPRSIQVAATVADFAVDEGGVQGVNF